MHKIIISQRAKNDLNKISFFCSGVSINYAQKVKKQIKSYIITLQVFPRGYPKLFDENAYYEYRKISLGRYQIIYIIQKNDVVIVRIIDTRRNPKKFKIN